LFKITGDSSHNHQPFDTLQMAGIFVGHNHQPFDTAATLDFQGQGMAHFEGLSSADHRYGYGLVCWYPQYYLPIIVL
jgi:hypothetical protein